jgi:hypothetical protein
MNRKLRGMGLLAVPLLALAALLGSVLPATAATGPDGFTILDADSGNVAHHCEVLGTNGNGVQAVVCVDIDTYGDSSGYYATGAIEAYCQDGSASYLVACSYIHIDGIFANQDSGATTAGYTCNGDCPSGRKILYVTTYDYTGGANCTSSSGHDVWTEAAGDTVMDTPDIGSWSIGTAYHTANDGSNYSSGHYWVCP